MQAFQCVCVCVCACVCVCVCVCVIFITAVANYLPSNGLLRHIVIEWIFSNNRYEKVSPAKRAR